MQQSETMHNTSWAREDSEEHSAGAGIYHGAVFLVSVPQKWDSAMVLLLLAAHRENGFPQLHTKQFSKS